MHEPNLLIETVQYILTGVGLRFFMYLKLRLSIYRSEFKFSFEIFSATFYWLQEEGIYFWYTPTFIFRDIS
jgi:hypothetical protein